MSPSQFLRPSFVSMLYFLPQDYNVLSIFRGLRPHPQKRWRRDECVKTMGLISSKQVRVCKGNIDLMPYIENSIRLIKDECKEQFGERTWDCSSIDKAPNFGFDLRSG